MDAQPTSWTTTGDRGIAPPKPSRRGADALPLVGFRVRGLGIADCDAINAVTDGGDSLGECSAEPVGGAPQPLRNLSVLSTSTGTPFGARPTSFWNAALVDAA